MRMAWNAWAALLLLSAACGDDDTTTEIHDGGSPDASAPTGIVSMDGSAAQGTDAGASAEELPPAEQNGKRLYAVRFDLRAGDAPFGCGKPATLGTASTVAEPTDARLYVHDVALVRANGERVPLDLHQDGRWQLDNVALIDFADDTGKCATNNPATRTAVYGYAPAQADYTGVAFKLGVPESKNHVNGAELPAPYNASGMWWSWSGGFKYVRMDLTSAAQPVWYFHLGATNCKGMTTTGFTCASNHVADIQLQGWDANSSVVVFDAKTFYGASDLSKAPVAPDGTPGCMAFNGDPECQPLFSTIGLVFQNDAAPRPEQSAFRLAAGTPWTLPTTPGKPPAPRLTNDPNAWPDPSYVRNPAFNVANVSKAGDKRSHPLGDPRHGASCTRCHQAQGPGLGLFTAAGTIFTEEGAPATGVKIEIVGGTPDRATKTIKDAKTYALLEVDQNGNFFTTEPLPYDTEKLTARVRGANDEVLATMYSTKQTGACNTCHTGSFRVHVPKVAH